MEQLKIGEQITFLRKQKGLTQEQVAQALGVSNQAVSKWESAQCSPDIQLLPEIAQYFNVSIDRLMGYTSKDTVENVYLNIKALFEKIPEKEVFHEACKLAFLLHEVAWTKGYKHQPKWDTNRNFGLSNERPWYYSCCSVDDGITAMSGKSIFITEHKESQALRPSQVRSLQTELKNLSEANVLRTLFGLYELTKEDEQLFVSIQEIAKQTKLAEVQVKDAIEYIPVQIKETEEGLLYHIQGSYMIVPALLKMILVDVIYC